MDKCAVAGNSVAHSPDGDRGLNVNIPFKLDVFAVPRTARERAHAAGGCNLWCGMPPDTAPVFSLLRPSR
jgi:hypothetical protein